MVLENGVKNIQARAFNGARMVYEKCSRLYKCAQAQVHA